MSNDNKLRWMYGGALAIGAIASAAPAFAQSSQLEIVITAQRRAESVQDVPLSVTALNQERLEQAGAVDVSRLELVTPGLTFGRSGTDVRPAIRGVRTENVEANSDPTIGIFVDGVYRARTSQGLEPFVDIQRVEVARGPQGTLFGRNTYGGSIAIYSNSPSTAGVDYGASAFGDEYESYGADGYVNVPVTDKVALRFAGLASTTDGFIENLQPGVDNYGAQDQFYLRGSALFNISPDVDLTLRATNWQIDGTGTGVFGYKVAGTLRDPATGATTVFGVLDPRNPRARSAGSTPDRGPYEIYRDVAGETDVEQTDFSAQLDWDFGSVAAKAIAAYSDVSAYRLNDDDFSNNRGTITIVDTSSEATSFELQLTSDYESAFQWLVGAFLFKEEVNEDFLSNNLRSGDTNVTYNFGGGTYTVSAPGPTDDSADIDFGNRRLAETNSVSVFAEGRLDFTDRVSGFAGVRWTEDDKDFTTLNITTGAAPTPRSGNQAFDETTWRAGLEFDVTADNLLYASAGTGFNSGGFNASTNVLVPFVFNSQTVTAYEIGSKNTLLDGRMLLNLSIFYNDFEDVLLRQYVEVASTVQSALVNAGTAKAAGAEVEAQWNPTDALQLIGTLAYLDAEFDSARVGDPFRSASIANVIDISGDKLALSPEWKASLYAGYTIQLGGSAGSLTPAVQVAYSDEYFANDVNFDQGVGKQDAYTKTDLRVTWRSAEERVSFQAFVENLEDEAVLNRVTVGGQSAIFQNFAAPRTIGARLSFRK